MDQSQPSISEYLPVLFYSAGNQRNSFQAHIIKCQGPIAQVTVRQIKLSFPVYHMLVFFRAISQTINLGSVHNLLRGAG